MDESFTGRIEKTQPEIRPQPESGGRRIGRRQFGRLAAGSILAAAFSGCVKSESSGGRLEKIWGEVGLGNGRFSKPRAIAIDKNDEIYIVDMTARIQVFDTDGRFLRGWQ